MAAALAGAGSLFSLLTRGFATSSQGVTGMDFNENMLHDSATPVQRWAGHTSAFELFRLPRSGQWDLQAAALEDVIQQLWQNATKAGMGDGTAQAQALIDEITAPTAASMP